MAKETPLWLRNATFITVLVLVLLAVTGLTIVAPILLAMHKHGATRVELALTPLAATSIALGAAGYWWLHQALRIIAAAGESDMGARNRALALYQSRASKLRLAAALLAYYVPAIVVTVVQHPGISAPEPKVAADLAGYFRAHLLDGFGFVGFLAIGWQLTTRDYHRAAQLLTQSSVIIAMAGAYVAGGTLLAVGLAAVGGELFFGQLWRFMTSSGVTAEQVVITNRGTDRLLASQQLRNGECLRSANGSYRLILFQGELAIWGTGDDGPVWSTGTLGSGADYAALDPDGRLVLYGSQGALVAWQSQGPGGGANMMQLLNNGALAGGRGEPGKPLWAIVPQPEQPYRDLTFRFTPVREPVSE